MIKIYYQRKNMSATISFDDQFHSYPYTLLGDIESKTEDLHEISTKEIVGKNNYYKFNTAYSDLDIINKRFFNILYNSLSCSFPPKFAEPLSYIVCDYLTDGKLRKTVLKIVPLIRENSGLFHSLLNCCKIDEDHAAYGKSLEFDPMKFSKDETVIITTTSDEIYLSSKMIYELAKEYKIDALSYLFTYLEIHKHWSSEYIRFGAGNEFIRCFSATSDYVIVKNDKKIAKYYPYYGEEKHFEITREVLLIVFLNRFPINEFLPSLPEINDRTDIKTYDDFPNFLLNRYFESAVQYNEINILAIFLKYRVPFSKFTFTFEVNLPTLDGSWKLFSNKQHAIYYPKVSNDTIRFWLRNGLPPSIKLKIDGVTKYLITPLLWAILIHNTIFVEILVSFYKVDITAPCLIAGKPTTPIEYAKKSGLILISEWLKSKQGKFSKESL